MRRSGEAIGTVFALVGSIGLGSAIAIARIAYDEGANGLSIAFPRAWLLVFLLLGFCELTGRRLTMSFKSWLACLFPGLLLSHMFYGNIAAAEFIPAAVAALLFFIFPPLVTIINAAVDRRPPSPIKLGATLIAFAGLAVMLGVSLDDLDWRGVALGLSAGVFCSINITWVARKLSHIDPVVSMTHMALVAAVVLTGATLFFGGAPLPSGGSGWAALLAAAAIQASCIPLFYIVLPVIGPERMGILSNIQPVATIIVAYLALGEALRPMQFLGAMMILGGILLMQYAAKRERPPTAPAPSPEPEAGVPETLPGSPTLENAQRHA
jgi:drug/metabolite transporter (DMT)-like permease